MPFTEACEEASMLMVAEYFRGNYSPRLAPAKASQAILKIVAWEKSNLGHHIDTSAAEVSFTLQEYYGLRAEVVPYTAPAVRQAIDSGQAVIVPLYGRALGNPHFKKPGPRYHMAVIKGYKDNFFIVHEPGTRYGKNYRYSEATLNRAVHDLNKGKVERGAQVMVIIKGGNKAE